MSVKLYQLYCEICGYKRLTDGSDVTDLAEVKTSPIPAGVPFIDPETKKLTVPKPKKQLKKFKCPRCGRVVMARKLAVPEEAQLGRSDDEKGESS